MDASPNYSSNDNFGVHLPHPEKELLAVLAQLGSQSPAHFVRVTHLFKKKWTKNLTTRLNKKYYSMVLDTIFIYT